MKYGKKRYRQDIKKQRKIHLLLRYMVHICQLKVYMKIERLFVERLK